MMPINPIGPPSETAAPVATDALKNATCCTRTTFTPRVAAASASRLSRFNDRGSHTNAALAMAASGKAARMGA